MAIDLASIRALDLVVFYEDTVRSIFERVAEYGILAVFKPKLPTKVGVLVRLYDNWFVVVIDKGLKLVPLKKIESRVVKIHRNWVFDSRTTEYECQSVLMNAIGLDWNKKKSLYNVAKEMNKGNINTVFAYLITAFKVSYPASFSNGKIKLSELLSYDAGFGEVQFKE